MSKTKKWHQGKTNQIFKDHYFHKGYTNNEGLYPFQNLIERGLLLEEKNYAILYQITYNKVSIEDEQMGVESCNTIDYLYCDQDGSIVELCGMLDVYLESSISKETLLQEARDGWKEKTKSYINDLIDCIENPPFILLDAIKIVKNKLLSYFPLLRTIYPDLIESAKKQIFVLVKEKK
jgi:hypothetical protein